MVKNFGQKIRSNVVVGSSLSQIFTSYSSLKSMNKLMWQLQIFIWCQVQKIHWLHHLPSTQRHMFCGIIFCCSILRVLKNTYVGQWGFCMVEHIRLFSIDNNAIANCYRKDWGWRFHHISSISLWNWSWNFKTMTWHLWACSRSHIKWSHIGLEKRLFIRN